MTMKYEKFEEWMVGKKISVDGHEGVVLGRHFPSIVPSDTACIRFKTGDDPCDWMWSELEDVTFLGEVLPKEETSAIPWEEGQEVYCLIRGKGRVSQVGRDSVVVWFDKVGAWKYTDKGELLGYEGVRTLFFSEPTIIADTMPPKKPFVPKLKEGDKVAVISKDDSDNSSVGEVMRENDFQVTFTDGRLFKKEYWNIFKLGEEIKWEN